MYKTKILPLIVLAILLASLAGCSSGAPTATEAPAVVEPTATPAAVPTETSAPTIVDGGRIELASGATSWYTNGDVQPKSTQRFVLSVQAGQQLSIWLTTDPQTNDSSLAYLSVISPQGQPLLTSPEMYFSQVVVESGDYTIDIVGYTDQVAYYTLSLELPVTAIDPALGMQYDLLDQSVCTTMADVASQALGVEFVIQPRSPFLDPVAGEAGQGCRMTASGDGTRFASPQAVIETLVASFGFTDQPAYRADGPTGSAAGLTRDMALMLISASWEPAMGVACPSDKPISECGLVPEQQMYTIRIDLAQFKATFSLDGHWEDPATGFTLDLGQDWKDIYGGHTVVAQGGNKIDSLETSITGMVSGNGADIVFQSSFAAGTGTARITVVDPNTITWQIVNAPDGEFYLPAEATLVRK